MRKRKPAVEWLLPSVKQSGMPSVKQSGMSGRKKPIAYSTIAVSDFIVAMAREYETVREIYDAINYDLEAKDVLGAYIDRGYGGVTAREIFW